MFLVTERPESVRTHSKSQEASFLEDCWRIHQLVRDDRAFSNFLERAHPYMLAVAKQVSRHLHLPNDIVPEVVDEAVLKMLEGVVPPTTSPAGWLRSRLLAAANRVAASYSCRGAVREVVLDPQSMSDRPGPS